LIDFGAMKEVSSATLLPAGQDSRTVAIGTPGYMPNEQLGGKPTPAIGFGMGIERVLMMLPDEQKSSGLDAYVVHAGEGAQKAASKLSETLRDAGLAVAQHGGGGSFKSQMKKADASGARYALIIGDNEVAAGAVAVKPMRGGNGAPIQGEQAIITTTAVAAHLRG